MPVIFLSKSN